MAPSANAGRFQYTGQMYLHEIGLSYYKARMYSAVLGRFMQTDPIGYQGGENLYDYVGDDPVNRSDPTGEYACDRTDPRCQTFLQAQEVAKSQVKREISAMRKLQTDLSSGAKLSKSELKLQGRINKYIGGGAGGDPKLIGQLIQKGQGTLGALEGWKHVDFSSKSNPEAYALTGPLSKSLTVYANLFTRSFAMVVETAAHEGSHDGARTMDFYRGYGNQNAQALAAKAGPQATLNNADSVAFAFGFTRDDWP